MAYLNTPKKVTFHLENKDVKVYVSPKLISLSHVLKLYFRDKEEGNTRVLNLNDMAPSIDETLTILNEVDSHGSVTIKCCPNAHLWYRFTHYMFESVPIVTCYCTYYAIGIYTEIDDSRVKRVPAPSITKEFTDFLKSLPCEKISEITDGLYDVKSIIKILREHYTESTTNNRLSVINVIDNEDALLKVMVGQYFFPYIDYHMRPCTYAFLSIFSKIDLSKLSTYHNRYEFCLESEMQLHAYLKELPREELRNVIDKVAKHSSVVICATSRLFEGDTMVEKLSKFYGIEFPLWFQDMIGTDLPLAMFGNLANYPKRTMILAGLLYLLKEPITMESKEWHIESFNPPPSNIKLKRLGNSEVKLGTYQITATTERTYIKLRDYIIGASHYVFALRPVNSI
ncbi:hypothetical protein KDA11_06435 [Candidatus Saccharibacteria bacterium]|nr:hypothetical protein [Candidatus Saccharibacteria bacterium]